MYVWLPNVVISWQQCWLAPLYWAATTTPGWLPLRCLFSCDYHGFVNLSSLSVILRAPVLCSWFSCLWRKLNTAQEIKIGCISMAVSVYSLWSVMIIQFEHFSIVFWRLFLWWYFPLGDTLDFINWWARRNFLWLWRMDLWYCSP